MRRAFESTLNRLVHHLVVCSGRSPTGFEASVSEGTVCIRHSAAVSHYEPDGWTSKFSRDLHRGNFDRPVLNEQVETSAVLRSSGTGWSGQP